MWGPRILCKRNLKWGLSCDVSLGDSLPDPRAFPSVLGRSIWTSSGEFAFPSELGDWNETPQSEVAASPVAEQTAGWCSTDGGC